MGLKLRMGLAVTGLALSSMFGVNMLAGVKDYVDTTGNIMVDIADGIGMVSKGIEALEYWLDPNSETKSSEPSPPGGETPVPPASPPEEVAPEPVPTPADANQPKVFCQKGKCYPYDPARMKNSNLNLEMKPGMILTPADGPNNSQKKQKPKQRRGRSGDDDEEDETEGNGKAELKTKASEEMILEVEKAKTQEPATIENNTTTVHGTKRLLSSVRNLLDVSSKIIVKLVYKIFPWNRRARRRVMGDGEDDEL